MASVTASRVQALIKARCDIFQTAYNPTAARTGAKYLRARLRGPSMINYYPPTANISKLARQWPELGLVNFNEAQRLRDVEDKKKRGKGTPPKSKAKGDSRRATRRR
ncbi:mitochondrial ribosomal subunit S27-domain-containing protein [Phlebopus sp. FC_14]|nr:mitochondrial ribosomal subunit S27-domain-containing protein [Phlebopus sp. FC_14]